MMFSSTFCQLISRPTGITNTSATLIDNIFVNKIDENYKCGILFTGLSDHLPVFLTTRSIKSKRHNNVNIKYRLMNERTISHLCQDLEYEDWGDIYSKTDVQEAYDQFYNKLFKFFDKKYAISDTQEKQIT